MPRGREREREQEQEWEQKEPPVLVTNAYLCKNTHHEIFVSSFITYAIAAALEIAGDSARWSVRFTREPLILIGSGPAATRDTARRVVRTEYVGLMVNAFSR